MVMATNLIVQSSIPLHWICFELAGIDCSFNCVVLFQFNTIQYVPCCSNSFHSVPLHGIRIEDKSSNNGSNSNHSNSNSSKKSSLLLFLGLDLDQALTQIRLIPVIVALGYTVHPSTGSRGGIEVPVHSAVRSLGSQGSPILVRCNDLKLLKCWTDWDEPACSL